VVGIAGVAGVAAGKGLTLSTVEALARKFYAENDAVHATEDSPDLPETPLGARLKKCQIAPQRALSHKSFAKFFGSKKFFAASCGDHRFAVISVDRARHVKLVALNPYERVVATARDVDIDDGFVISSTRDFREFVAAWIYLKTLIDVPAREIQVTEESGTGERAQSHYLKGTWGAGPSAARQPKTYEVTVVSRDNRTYSIASHSLPE